MSNHSRRASGIACLCAILGFAGAAAWGYDYDENDETQGAGADAAWRTTAQWDTVDETSTHDIHEYTTDARYLTPMVSYVPEHPDVPSPRDVLGYTVGTEGKLTRPTDEIRYFRTLAEASPRVLLTEMGDTEEGRTMHLVVISDEANLARLDEFKSYTAALADPRDFNEAAAAGIAARAKPIVHITAGLHSPETGPPEMVMELAYRLAVSEHPDIKSIRENTVVLITPITEVDGRAKVVDWYYRYLSEYESRDYIPSISPPYWGKYSFHDNNRDGIQMSQKLTQNYMKTFMEWHPTYSLDLHESVPLLYVSTGTGPYNRTLDPLVIREWQWFAHYELAELQKHGLPGVWTWGFYTGWNPSYLLWITNNHNSHGRFFETFGNSSARTMERDLSETKFAGKDVTTQQWYRADPPEEKIVWSLRNNTNYMQSGTLASLKLVAQEGETLLKNFWTKGHNAIERGKNEAPHGWVIPREQRDRFRLAHLLNQLQRHGVEIHQATADFELEDGNFSEGDYIVRLDQPYGPHAKNLLEDQTFPEDAEYRPYDDVSWTFGLIYRVDTVEIEDKALLELAAIRRVNDPVHFPGTVDGGDPRAYAIRHDGNNALITARYKLGRFEVLAATEEFEADGESFPRGSWILPHRRGLQGILRQLAEELMFDVVSLDDVPKVETQKVDVPRIALYHNWVSTQNDGWLRFTLEQAGVPFDYIADYTVRQGNLRRKYDVILMAHQGATPTKAMIHGRDPKFGPMAYNRTREFESHGFVDGARDITGGLGFEGLASLETFLDKGGTLILLGSAGKLATDTGLLRNVGRLPARKVNTPGSSVQVKIVREDHPIAYGFEEVNHVFRVNGPVYTVPKKYDHWIVVQYGTAPLRDDEEDEDDDGSAEEESDESDGDDSPEEDKPEKKDEKFLLSGYVSGESELEKKGAVLDVPRNAGGRVILYSFNPLHRHLNHGDHNYLYNALLHWNDFPDPEPKDHPGLVKD